LQNGGTDEEFFCNGGIQVGRNYISCQNGERHGKVNLEKGFSQSCNVYFIELAKKITAQKLYETVISLGFNEEITLADGLVSKKSNLPTLKNLSSKTALANLSIGQGELLATPLQIARLVSVVAGDGTLKTPYLVKGFLDEKGVITSYDKTLISNQVITSQTANRIKGLMISTALNGTGLRANPDRGGAGVKTATAQTGIKKDGKDVIQAWIGGFFPSALPKYAVAILVENGISGGRSGGPIFKYIAENGYDYIKSNTLLN
jgi:penicillin-binding protein 2